MLMLALKVLMGAAVNEETTYKYAREVFMKLLYEVPRDVVSGG